MKFVQLASAATCALALLSASAVSAATIYSENFNDTGFQGATGINIPDTTDHWASANLYTINNYDGWTFTGSAGYYVNLATGPLDGAVLLNECCIGDGQGATASTAISGLTAGKTYQVSLLEWGDNRPGGAYTLYTQLGSSPAEAFNGVDGAAGSSAGVALSYKFVADASSETLTFSQGNSTGGASPIIDNLSVSAVPEPAAWSLMILGMGGVGAALRTRRRKTVAA